MRNDDQLTAREHASLSEAIDAGVDHLERRRAQRRFAIAGGAAAVLVAAIVGTSFAAGNQLSGGRDVAATPSQSASPTARATPSPTETVPAPTAVVDPPVVSPPPPPTDDSDPTQWMVTDVGIGPVRLGDDFSSAIAAFSDAASCRPDADPAYRAQNGSLWIVRGFEDYETVGVVSWDRWDIEAANFREGPRTERGIGIGATEAEVRAAYPDAEYTIIDEGRIIARDGLVTMRTRDGVVMQLSVSHRVPEDYCA